MFLSGFRFVSNEKDVEKWERACFVYDDDEKSDRCATEIGTSTNSYGTKYTISLYLTRINHIIRADGAGSHARFALGVKTVFKYICEHAWRICVDPMRDIGRERGSIPSDASLALMPNLE